ncbi:MAG: hypothetical protein N4A49_13065 [Marinifilaceae bacterium]|jgi:hypothetical protein|nr:hypothetical protein [Marinifilaceae bacterium]
MKLNFVKLFVLIFCLSGAVKAQTKIELPIDVKFKGYVHSLFTYDTRQVVGGREAHILFYPLPENLDVNGRDLNGSDSYHMAVIQTRLGMKIKGPDILNAKSSGFLETEFIGNSNSDVNGFRIRHAYFNLDWGKHSLLVGQTWSPMFTVEVMPGQIGSNCGLPFKPFARNPQVRYTYKTESFKAMAALMTERDYTSAGPNGYSNKYLRDAALPIFQSQIQYYAGKHIFGLAGEYKILKPTVANPLSGLYTSETIKSNSLTAYMKLQFNKFSFKAQSTYGENMTDMLMMGGYAVSEITDNSIKYTPISTHANWVDLNYTHKNTGFGLYLAYAKNLGSKDDVVTNMIYARGADISELYRIAPRITKKIKNININFETEYTCAKYGTTISDNAKVKDTNDVANTRFTLSVYYHF